MTNQARIRFNLAQCLRGIIAQVLLRRIDQDSRCAAMEIMLPTPKVRELIRSGQTHRIASEIQSENESGMQSMGDAIMDLLLKDWIDPVDARAICTDKTRFEIGYLANQKAKLEAKVADLEKAIQDLKASTPTDEETQ